MTSEPRSIPDAGLNKAASVVGAPGLGKTFTAKSGVARLLDDPKFGEMDPDDIGRIMSVRGGRGGRAQGQGFREQALRSDMDGARGHVQREKPATEGRCGISEPLGTGERETMSADLDWQKIQALFAGQIMFGARRGRRAFVVSFTPDYGWGASMKVGDRPTQIAPDAPFETIEQAKAAITRLRGGGHA